MFYLFLKFSIFSSTLIFYFMNHPIAMGLMLMLQTLLICMITGMITKTFWFSYVLFLIFLGGMLVLLIYVTSLASNEMFLFSSKIFLFIIIFFLSLFLFMFMVDKNFLSNFMMNNEMNNIINQKSFILENSLMLNKLYNFPMNMITILLMIYLFLTLIAVVKITNIFEGPLRPKSNN